MSYIQTITNTNDTGAGSLRATLAAHTSGRPTKMIFSTSGTIAAASPINITKRRVKVSGGDQKVIISPSYDAAGEYILTAKADGVSLEHLAVDCTALGHTGSGMLVGDGTASLAQPYVGFSAKHCYFRGNTDDSFNVIGRTAGLIYCEYCIFNGDHSALVSALAAYSSNPRVKVIFKHCLFLGVVRIPDVVTGIVTLAGCVIAQRWQGGRVYGGGRINLVNNWMQTPSSGANDQTPIVTDISTSYNGETLADGSIYSSGNMLDGVDESTVGRAMYYETNFGGQSASRLFRTTPWGKLPPVPDAATSRQLVLKYAGCYRNRSTNDAAAIALAAFRRPASNSTGY